MLEYTGINKASAAPCLLLSIVVVNLSDSYASCSLYILAQTALILNPLTIMINLVKCKELP